MSAGNKYGSIKSKAQQVYLGAGAGGVYIGDTTQYDGNFESIDVLAAAVANITSPDVSGDLSAVALPVGMHLNINFTRIKLASGKIIANYGAKPSS